MGTPTLAGYQDFITNTMGIAATYLPATAPVVQTSYNVAIDMVNLDLTLTAVYDLAVYNLAGSLLLNFAPDQPGQTYFQTLRSEGGFNLTAFQPGVVAASGDESTSESLLVPEFMKGLTLGDLQRLKDPYGRTYLAIAQDCGPAVWGSS